MKTVVIFILLLVFPSLVSAEMQWRQCNSGLSDTDIFSISVFPGDERLICAAADKAAYLSEDSGVSWKNIVSLKTESRRINFLTFDVNSPRVVYLATTQGLLVSRDKGASWSRIFGSPNENLNNVRWVTLDAHNSQRIYIGTEAGLYLSHNSGKNWERAKKGLPRAQVRSILVSPFDSSQLYLANTYGLFKSTDSGGSWRKIYGTRHKQADDTEIEEDESTDEEINGGQNLINSIALDKGSAERIFIATGEGVLLSADAGRTWNRLSRQGLICSYVNYIVTSDKEDALYAATKNGVFKFLFDEERWIKVYEGMSAQSVRMLYLDGDRDRLIAATDRGVFSTRRQKYAARPKREPKNQQKDYQRILDEIAHKEPAIDQVREAALRYGEVIHPKQIKSLRRNARLKALLPDISLDYDKSIYGSATEQMSFVAPHDWSLSFSWDVGDLLFSEQLRLIDSNVRLAVQLRDDILNEVTRLYYERRRLQTEVILNPAHNTQEELARRLKLEELTANIDALTGGFFSRQLTQLEQGQQR